MTRVLVLGGTGFVGSAVCAALVATGDEVTCADIAPPRPATARLLEGVPFRPVRVQDFHEVARAVQDVRPDVLVTLSYVAGAPSEDDPYTAALVNLQGPMNCLEAAALGGVRRVVYASSIAVYGPDQAHYGERDLDEGDSCPLDTHTLSYGATKAVNEFLTHKFIGRHDLAACGLRLSIVFGHGREQGFTTWASDVGSAPPFGDPVRIPFRSGQRSSLVFVDDAADLFVRAVHDDRPGSHVYNSGGHTVTMAELADAVRAIEPRAEVTFDEDAASQPFVSRVSGTRAQRDLGFRMTPLDAALRRHMDRALALRGSPGRYAPAG